LRDELEQLGVHPDRLSAGFLLDFWTAPELLKEAAIGVTEFGGSIAQDLRRHLAEKGRWNFFAHRSAVIPIFMHFRVVEEPLAPNPAE
jgi:hypothetical protein